MYVIYLLLIIIGLVSAGPVQDVCSKETCNGREVCQGRYVYLYWKKQPGRVFWYKDFDIREMSNCLLEDCFYWKTRRENSIVYYSVNNDVWSKPPVEINNDHSIRIKGASGFYVCQLISDRDITFAARIEFTVKQCDEDKMFDMKFKELYSLDQEIELT